MQTLVPRQEENNTAAPWLVLQAEGGGKTLHKLPEQPLLFL